MSRAIILLSLCLVLASCGESDIERNQRQDQMCQSYGAKPGSDIYIMCRATITTAEAAKRRSDDASAMAGAAMGYAAATSGMATGSARR